MNIYIPYTARLPSAYQEVEYIETTGTQYITTSITPNTNTQVEVKIEVTTTAMDKTIFGTNRGSTYYHLTPYSNAWYYGLNGGESHAGTYSNVVGTQYEVVYNNSNSQLSINGTEVGSTSGTTSTNPLEIAKRASDNTKGVFKYFYFNVYDKSGSKYIMKLIPCYRKSDSVIGMYDLVNDQFYTNSGTGTFTKGNDVTMSEVKNIYIGEYKGFEYSYDFRNKTKAEAESDGWVFDSATYGFSSNGIYKTGSGVGYVRYTADISSYKTLKLSGTGTVSGTYTGISLIGGTTSVGFVDWLYRPSGLGVFYNDANHYVGSALGYGDFSWEIEIDLDTGDLTSSCSNGQTIAGTLNSSYLSALKQSNTTIGIGFNDDNGYIQTFNAQAIPA